MRKYLIFPCSPERHKEVFSDLTSLSEGLHHLSMSSKLLENKSACVNQPQRNTFRFLHPTLESTVMYGLSDELMHLKVSSFLTVSQRRQHSNQTYPCRHLSGLNVLALDAVCAAAAKGQR